MIQINVVDFLHKDGQMMEIGVLDMYLKMLQIVRHLNFSSMEGCWWWVCRRKVVLYLFIFSGR